MEIQITNDAIEKIKSMAKEYNIEPTVRIYVESTACKGASFGIAFDEPKQFDILTDIDGIEITTDTTFLPKYCDGLSIDYICGSKEGYIIKSLRPVNSKCNSGCSNNSNSNHHHVHQEGNCGGCNGGGCSHEHAPNKKN